VQTHPCSGFDAGRTTPERQVFADSFKTRRGLNACG
jgi:hypothetical protein